MAVPDMLLQTNSYIVPKDKRSEHARLMGRFRQCFRRLGSQLEVYEQTGPGFAGDGGGRFVQIMRFRDRRHHAEVNAREKTDPVAQRLISEFCALVNIPYQQQHGLFAAAFYAGILRESRDEAEAEHASAAVAEHTPGETPHEPHDIGPSLGDLARGTSAENDHVSNTSSAADDDADPFTDELEGEVASEHDERPESEHQGRVTGSHD